MQKQILAFLKKVANSMTWSHDAGDKDPALSSVDSLLIVRCQKGRKLSI